MIIELDILMIYIVRQRNNIIECFKYFKYLIFYILGFRNIYWLIYDVITLSLIIIIKNIQDYLGVFEFNR